MVVCDSAWQCIGVHGSVYGSVCGSAMYCVVVRNSVCGGVW